MRTASLLAVLIPFAIVGGVWAFAKPPVEPVTGVPDDIIHVNLISAGAVVWLCDTKHTIGTEIKCTDGNVILISDEVRKWIVPSTRRLVK